MEHQVIDQMARDLAREALAAIRAHEKECKMMRDIQTQWQQSATRVLEEMRRDTNKFREEVSDKLDGWNSFIIKTLVGITAGSFTIVGVLFWKFVIP